MKKDHTYLPEVVIDTHCHPRDLEQSYKTTIEQTMFEAFMSGIDISFYMPNSIPAIKDIQTLKLGIKKARAAKKKFNLQHEQKFFFGITDDNLDECKEALYFDEVVGLKDYPMSRTGKTVTTGSIGVKFKKTRLAGMKLTRNANKVYARHCSNAEINRKEKDSDRSVIYDIAETAELMTRVPGAKTTICHVPNITGAELILSCQRKGLKMAIEICPHYLMFSSDKVNWNSELHPVFYWCFNNLRPSFNLNYLRALAATARNNNLVFIGSDNAPHTRDEKLESVKKGKWIGGLPSNRHLLPTVITLAKLYVWSHEHLARLISWNAADHYGIEVPRELRRQEIEFRRDTGNYNNGIVENPWSHLKMWYPAGKE